MLVRSKFWYLENFNFRHTLTEEERKKVAEMVVMQTVPKKEVLYFSSQSSHCVYLLKEGKVKVYRKAADGKEIILNIIGPGGLFGELGLAGQKEREEVAEAIEDVIVCKITMEDMRELMNSIPSLNTEILNRLGSRFKKVQSRLESLICKSSEERIRSTIKELALEHGRVIANNPEQIELRLTLTHADIAKLTATSRQNVSTLFRELEKKDLIKYDRRRIYIKNLSLL